MMMQNGSSDCSELMDDDPADISGDMAGASDALPAMSPSVEVLVLRERVKCLEEWHYREVLAIFEALHPASDTLSTSDLPASSNPRSSRSWWWPFRRLPQ